MEHQRKAKIEMWDLYMPGMRGEEGHDRGNGIETETKERGLI